MRYRVLCLIIGSQLLALLTVCGQAGHGREAVFEINGTKIYTTTIGTGEPLVVVHGGPGLAHNYLFEPFSQLADRYTLIFYDQRGCGKSEAFKSMDTVSMDVMVEDLEGIRKAYNYAAVNLAGQSWGALIALNYTLKYGEKVKNLLLLEPAPGSSEYLTQVQKRIIERLSESDKKTLASLAQSPLLRSDAAVFQQFMTVRTNAYFHDSTFARLPRFAYFDTMLVRKFFSSSAMFSSYLMKYDLYAALGSIETPTLIVHGEEDVIPTTAITRLGTSIRRAEMHIIPACGHFVHIEKPKDYFAVIREFLSR